MSKNEVFILGDTRVEAVPCDSDRCAHCIFHNGNECTASDLFEGGYLPVCDPSCEPDGIGYNCYYRIAD